MSVAPSSKFLASIGGVSCVNTCPSLTSIVGIGSTGTRPLAFGSLIIVVLRGQQLALHESSYSPGHRCLYGKALIEHIFVFIPSHCGWRRHTAAFKFRGPKARRQARAARPATDKSLLSAMTHGGRPSSPVEHEVHAQSSLLTDWTAIVNYLLDGVVWPDIGRPSKIHYKTCHQKYIEN